MLLGAGANPWEKMASLYGTVLRDPSDGLFKMWYLTGPYADGMIEVRGRQALGNITLLGYATSQDGCVGGGGGGGGVFADDAGGGRGRGVAYKRRLPWMNAGRGDGRYGNGAGGLCGGGGGGRLPGCGA